MSDKETLIRVRNRNHQRLLEELERLVVCINCYVHFFPVNLELQLKSMTGLKFFNPEF
jgi:hypothetical protein